MKKSRAAKKKKPRKVFDLEWVFEPLLSDSTFCQKRMFGGLAAYAQGRMVMVLCESPGERSYRGRSYDYDIWNGVLFPTEREYHQSLLEQFQTLMAHPVLGKWLYLPVVSDDFEETIREMGDLIAERDARFGIDPKIK